MRSKMTGPVPPPAFSNYPLLWLGLCFAIGICAAKYLSLGLEVSAAICIAAAAAAGLLARHRQSVFLVFAAFCAAGSTTYLIHDGNPDNQLKAIYDTGEIPSGEPIEIVGRVSGNSEEAVDGSFITVETERLIYKGEERRISGRVRLFALTGNIESAQDYDVLNLRNGAKIRVACDPIREESYQNPGVLSRKVLLDWQDIDATATLKSPLLVEKLEDAGAWNPLDSILAIRQNLTDEFRKSFTAPTAGVLIASLLGNKHFLDKNSAEVFREGGTFHILVISGLHITFIGGLGILITGFFTRQKFVQFAAVTSFLWIYTAAVGAEVPVVRASLMFTILLFSQVIYRNGTLLNALGACSLILLVWRPQDLFGPSFQLTFISVAAIVIMGFPLIEKLRSIGNWTPATRQPFPPLVPDWLKRFCETLYWNEAAWKLEAKRNVWSANLFKSPYFGSSRYETLRRTAVFLFEGILISVIVQLCLLPFLVVYFHRVSVISVVLNLWAGVVIALESFAALIAVLFSQFSGPLALPFVKLTEVLNWLLIAVPDLFVQNNWASFRLPVYTGWPGIIYAVYLIPVTALAIAVYRWDPFALPGAAKGRHVRSTAICALTAMVVFAGVIIIFHPFSASRPDGRLHVDFLDVGQGDSAFVTFPNGETMLVDGGGRIRYKRKDTGEDDEAPAFEPDVPSVGESVVSEFLWEKGYSKLDYIVATHADADHIRGLVDVARNFSIGSALVGRSPMADPNFAAFADVLRHRGIPAKTVGRGEHLTVGGVTVEILYPGPTGDPDAVSDNDHSVVIRIVMGNRSFLLTGDIERRAEWELVHGGQTLSADLVKVPHHGSRTSSTREFIDAVGADYAVIPVGRSSVFGHPHPEVVERWKASGANVMTTGERGTISVSTDGKDLKITTFLRNLD